MPNKAWIIIVNSTQEVWGTDANGTAGFVKPQRPNRVWFFESPEEAMEAFKEAGKLRSEAEIFEYNKERA